MLNKEKKKEEKINKITENVAWSFAIEQSKYMPYVSCRITIGFGPMISWIIILFHKTLILIKIAHHNCKK
jgi:hypothetical protein